MHVAELFCAGGALARALPGYREREAQKALAEAIADCLRRRGVLVAEAGTGTGKTWAYLAPALLSEGKVLISTGTRTLQDQLFRRDIPRLREALAVSSRVALLKGRSNYVCHYHLERLAGDPRALKSRHEVGQLRHIQVFAQQSATGDRSELASVPEEADLWQRVTSTRENCLGQECPNVRDCFVLKARRRAQEADVVVVNHALFMADVALREEGVTDLLPSAELVVFDEAHQLPDVATRFMGELLSSHQWLDLARSAEAAGLAHAREGARWSELGRRLETEAKALRLAAAPIEHLPGRRVVFESAPDLPALETALNALGSALSALAAALMIVADAHPDLQAVWRSAVDQLQRLSKWRQQAAPEADGHIPGEPGALLPPVGPSGPQVRWVELSPHSVRLLSAPLSVAEAFSRCRSPGQAWVFTSATLTVQGDFGHFISQLGLQEAELRHWSSPFDYARQALLYVPQALPPAGGRLFDEAFAEALLPLLKAAPGGALVLCTTLRAVQALADLLRWRLEDEGLERPVLAQGERARGRLLEDFRALGNAVLVGSASFWEGVDVPGDALTLVAIDRLPFAPPDDPVMAARLRACREAGGNPFEQLQLPGAAIALKQGAGRLIRTETDWGVLMVGDTRLVDKPYGKRLWRGLPPFARTRVAAEAEAFLRERSAAPASPAAAPAAEEVRTS